ncbi:MAG: hypothetical protein MZV70_52765 [Desulfobacterales bacterium]|nr:hypothetical protein [Desulfobacterales bacterium]
MAQICQAFGLDHDVLAVRVGPGGHAARARRAAESQELQRRRLHPRRYGHRAPAPRSRSTARSSRRRGSLFIVDGVCATGGIAGADGRLGHRRRPDRGPEVPGRAARPGRRVVLSELAMEKRRGLAAVPAYYSDLLRWLPVMRDPSKYFSTPCVNEIRAFAEATRIILEEGMEDRVRAPRPASPRPFGPAWPPSASASSPSRASAASTLSVVRYPDGVDDKAFRAGLAAAGVVVAGGLGPTAGPGLPHGPHGQPDRRPRSGSRSRRWSRRSGRWATRSESGTRARRPSTAVLEG